MEPVPTCTQAPLNTLGWAHSLSYSPLSVSPSLSPPQRPGPARGHLAHVAGPLWGFHGELSSGGPGWDFPSGWKPDPKAQAGSKGRKCLPQTWRERERGEREKEGERSGRPGIAATGLGSCRATEPGDPKGPGAGLLVGKGTAGRGTATHGGVALGAGCHVPLLFCP